MMASMLTGNGLVTSPSNKNLETQTELLLNSAYPIPLDSLVGFPAKHNLISHDKTNTPLDFIRGLKEAASLYPKSVVRQANAVSRAFSITAVYKDRTILGRVHQGKGQFDVYVQANSQTPPAGCTCEDSNAKYPCEHSYSFIQWLIQQISTPNSTLYNQIESKAFDVGTLDKSEFKYDSSLKIVSEMDTLLARFSRSGPSDTDASDDALPPPSIRESDQSRIAWNIDSRFDLSIHPMVQQPRKRGGGWLKGRKVDMAILFQNENRLSEVDLRVRSKVKIAASNSSYYTNPYTYDIGEILFELIGQPCVTLDGDPVEVAALDATLTVQKLKSGLKFVFDNDPETRRLSVNKTSIIQIDRHQNRVFVSKVTEQQASFTKELLELASVSVQREKEFFERAFKFQRFVDLKLPTDVAGPTVSDPSSHAIILRANTDGSLDYGIRVRLSDDRLVKPAEGPAIRSSTKDNKPVQLVRQMSEERLQFNSLSMRLGLDSNNTDGTLDDFEKTFSLIEALQTSESDIEVLWDKTSEAPIRMLGTISAQNVRVGITQKRDWFNLTGSCTIGDQEFDIISLMENLRVDAEGARRGDFIKLKDGGWAKISEQLRNSLNQIRDSVNQERGVLKFDRTSAVALREAEQHLQIQSTKAWQDCLARLHRSETLEPVLPTGLRANLRDYQVDGFKWLRRLAEWGVGGILADDMGLGKTVQTLGAIVDRASEGPTLVIAPTSVCFNWMREVEKFAPDMSAFMYRETDRAEFLSTLGKDQIVVCSYGLALRDAEQLAKVDWATMVLDEAQAVKNSRSKTSMAIATIPSKWTIALTGTPVENHLGELWSLFRIVAPGVFGSWEQFRIRFAGPIERDNDDERRVALRNRLQPFVLRRTKSEVLKDLPARTEMNLYVELSHAERTLYDEVRLTAIGEADAIAKLPDVQDQRFKILALLTRLRQISCHPKMVHESWNQGSAKLTQLTETLLQLREEGHRVLIFSQFVSHLKLIREMMDTEKITYQYLDGKTPPATRQTEVDKFQNGDATAFLISLKAGGSGLNLTAADYVIHMDPWWNPAVEDQASDRAHRIGQQRPVMVYRIVAQNTIEEEILRLHDTKRDLVAGILDGTHSAGKLSTADLLALIKT